MSKVLRIAAAGFAVAGLIVATGGAAAFGTLAGALGTTITGTAISASALLTAAHALHRKCSALLRERLA